MSLLKKANGLYQISDIGCLEVRKIRKILPVCRLLNCPEKMVTVNFMANEALSGIN